MAYSKLGFFNFISHHSLKTKFLNTHFHETQFMSTFSHKQTKRFFLETMQIIRYNFNLMLYPNEEIVPLFLHEEKVLSEWRKVNIPRGFLPPLKIIALVKNNIVLLKKNVWGLIYFTLCIRNYILKFKNSISVKHNKTY